MNAALTERLVYVARAARDAGMVNAVQYTTLPVLNLACPAPLCCAG
ncbi:Uncharacterised protein [Escherichia coli]|nr:Uncharacterised protein [Escherichia coli]STF36585.1 Uncharacterised protein [Escherichia coli]